MLERTENRCEYCHLHQAGQEASFHADHVTPIKSGGETSLENFALACVSCSLHKSAKEFVFDPETNEFVPIFHPRQQEWADQFHWVGFYMTGLTATGRATIEALKQNRPIILARRRTNPGQSPITSPPLPLSVPISRLHCAWLNEVNMRPKTVSATDAKNRFGGVLREVNQTDEPIKVKKYFGQINMEVKLS